MNTAPKPEEVRPLTDAELAQAKRRRLPFAIAMLVAVDVLSAKFFIWDVLEAARAHSPNIRYWMKAIFITGMIPGVLVLMVLATRIPNFDARIRERKWVFYVAIALVALPGIALLAWFDHEITALGYGRR